eukprot:3053550-Amphidinium_carterae.2
MEGEVLEDMVVAGEVVEDEVLDDVEEARAIQVRMTSNRAASCGIASAGSRWLRNGVAWCIHSGWEGSTLDDARDVVVDGVVDAMVERVVKVADMLVDVDEVYVDAVVDLGARAARSEAGCAARSGGARAARSHGACAA